MDLFSRHAISFQCFHIKSGCISDSANTDHMFILEGRKGFGWAGKKTNIQRIKHRSENSVWFVMLKHSAVLPSTYFSGCSAWSLI